MCATKETEEDKAGRHLELNVARVDDRALNVARAVTKARRRLLLRSLEQAQKVDLVLREAHAAPTATRRRLDHQREPDLGGDLERSLLRFDEALGPRDAGHTCITLPV